MLSASVGRSPEDAGILELSHEAFPSSASEPFFSYCGFKFGTAPYLNMRLCSYMLLWTRICFVQDIKQVPASHVYAIPNPAIAPA
jgi:hypothetical protein